MVYSCWKKDMKPFFMKLSVTEAFFIFEKTYDMIVGIFSFLVS